MAGRPTDYTPELIEAAREYMNKEHETIPTVAGLALHLDISRETCHTWAKDADKPAFSDIYRRIMSAQEDKLINGGLSNKFNATITKLMLSKHGYVEKQELTGKDGKDLIPSEIDQMSNEQLEAVIEGRSA